MLLVVRCLLRVVFCGLCSGVCSLLCVVCCLYWCLRVVGVVFVVCYVLFVVCCLMFEVFLFLCFCVLLVNASAG